MLGKMHFELNREIKMRKKMMIKSFKGKIIYNSKVFPKQHLNLLSL